MTLDSSKTGVYGIIHNVSGKIYVGSASRSFTERWRLHKSQLNRGIHHSILLQRSWTKYGGSAFQFVVLAVCDPSECLVVEQKYIDKFRASEPASGFNICPKASSNAGTKQSSETIAKRVAKLKGRIISQETREKISRALTGRKKSPETIEKPAAAQRGRKHTPEARAKMSAAQIGRKRTPEEIDRWRKSNAGRKCTEAHKAKMAEYWTGRKRSSESVEKSASSRRGAKRTDEQRARMSEGWANRRLRLSQIQSDPHAVISQILEVASQ